MRFDLPDWLSNNLYADIYSISVFGIGASSVFPNIPGNSKPVSPVSRLYALIQIFLLANAGRGVVAVGVGPMII